MNRHDPIRNLDRAWIARESALDRMIFSDLNRLPQTRLNSPAQPADPADPAPSDTPDPSQPSHSELSLDPMLTIDHRLEIEGREFWFSGHAILCRCPDCSAPMSVRIWLGLADCWRCHCSLELSEVELRQLRPAGPATTRPAEWVPPPARSATSTRFDPERIPVAIERGGSQAAELEQLLAGTALARGVRGFFQSLPAWLVSFLLHLVLLLLLAMIVLQQANPDGIRIVLSTFLDKSRTLGGEVQLQNPLDSLADDLLPPVDLETAEIDARELQQAALDAAELAEDPQPLSNLPDLDQVRRNLTTDRATSQSFLARDPRLRAEIVERAGGTTLTEAAVARGLRWLASVQNQDGSWSLANYDRHDRPSNRGDSAATSLALLPFLGAGQTQEFGMYKATVARGLGWLLAHQEPNGDLRADFPGQAGMYAHGQATIVLCEAYAMTGDEKLRQPAQAAIDFIQAAQHPRGGWRYQPGEAGDTSVLGWQVMALQSARAAGGGLQVDDATLQLADYFLDSVSKSSRSRLPQGALYRYLPDGGEFTPAMTAEGLLCRMYLGWKRENPRLTAGVRWLVENHLPQSDQRNLYYWYYGTQVMHHYGGPSWDRWNRAVRQLLVESQRTSGKYPGSWEPDDYEWGAQGERIFVTSLAVCTLEVYYRHLPLFAALDLDE